MKKMILLFFILLTGCATHPVVVPSEKLVVNHVEYVIRVPPSDIMALPVPVAKLDVDQADQADVAGWILSKERYERELENKLRDIARFFVKSKNELDQKAAEENAEALKKAEEENRHAIENASSRSVENHPVPIP